MTSPQSDTPPGSGPTGRRSERTFLSFVTPLVAPFDVMTRSMTRTLTHAVADVPSGIRYMVIGAFWFSIMSVLVKLAGRTVPSMDIVLYRGLVTILLSAWVMQRNRVRPFFGVQRGLLVLRGVFGSLALACFIFSLVHLPLGEATLIQYTNPVFAIVIAAVWYHEHIGRRELVALVASMLGVLLIARPAVIFGGTQDAVPLGYVAIALGGAACSGAAYATIRRLISEDSRVVVFYLPLLQIPMALPFVIGHWRNPSLVEWAMLIGAGVATQAAQTYMTRGLQLERTARATTAGYLQIIFAAAWAVLVFGERFTVWTIIGALVIVGGASLLVLGRGRPEPARAS